MTNIFPIIRTIDDVLPYIQDKKEIAMSKGLNDTTIISYMFMDNHTFDTPIAKECRGITFDRTGKLVGRPLHKFFNVGEKIPKEDLPWSQVYRVMKKLDGSIVHTVWMDDQLWFKSKTSFSSHIAKFVNEYVKRPEQAGLLRFCEDLANDGYTAIFEYTGPLARIVVPYKTEELRLLHVRHNETGDYIKYDLDGSYFGELAAGNVKCVTEHDATFSPYYYLDALENMTGEEGYVFQFSDGDMVKAKCPWYLRLHRCISLTRYRDIAEAALSETLDDIKAALTELNISLAVVNQIESEVMQELITMKTAVEIMAQKYEGQDRKTIALAYQGTPYFGLIMQAYSGKYPDYKKYYKNNILKDKWSLDIIPDVCEVEN